MTLSLLIIIEKERKKNVYLSKHFHKITNRKQETQLRNQTRYLPVQMRGGRAADSTVVQLVVERSDFVLSDHRVGQGGVL